MKNRLKELSDKVNEYHLELTKLKKARQTPNIKSKIAEYNLAIKNLTKEIEKLNKIAIHQTSIPKEKAPAEEPKKTILKQTKKNINIDEKKLKEYISQTGINEEELESLKKLARKEYKKEDSKIKEYETYHTNELSQFSNKLFRKKSESIIKKYEKELGPLFHSIRQSGLTFLPSTYLSITFFIALIILSSVLSISLIYTLLISNLSIISAITISILLTVILTGAALMVAYFYPSTIAKSRKTKIKNDLPFLIVHMSAIAGSGAHPIAMFEMILNSGDYLGANMEIKKIINYTHLFGFNLTTALRRTAIETPSQEFKDFLVGLITVIESGGNLRDYLTAKASEAMDEYQTQRKKYLSALNTYSDIYIGAFVAAPLMFFIAIMIIPSVTGSSKIGGIGIGLIANIGIYLALPIMNAFFLLFLNMIKPE